MSGTIGLVIVYATVALGVEPQEEAATILRQSGVTGGLLVHVGCGEGELTAALGESESYLVHGLDASLRNVQQARKRLREAGRYGRVSVEQWRGGQLPYMDNIVNLLVLSEPTRVTPAEAMRVLAPRGVLCTRRGEAWVQTVKPQPGNTDDWTHALYNASNNPVAADEAVGPPYHIQWVAEPHHTRHHEHLASISVVVEDAGRLFYIIDEAPTASIFLRPSWALVARDAYNGLLLWKRSIARWESHMLGFRSGPAALSRRLVAVGGRVYVTLGYEAPVTALEAATGETLHTYEDTKGTEEILCAEGLLFMVAKRSGMPNPRRTDEPPSKLIAVLRTDTGELLWRKENLQPLPNTLAVAGGQAFLLDQERGVLSLDAHTGEELWRTARPVAPTRPGWSSPTLLVHDEVVLCADRDLQPLPDLDEQTGKPTARWLADEGASGELTAYKATTGEILWSTRVAETYHSPIDVFVIDGLVWFGRSRSRTFADFTEGRDLQTGEIKRQIATDEAFKTTMPHHRCHRNRATGHYILMGRTGVEFIDVRTGACARHHWTRGVCQYGYIPANGLLYVPPHSCACYIEAKLAGFYAYAPKRADSVPLPPEKRLTRGPAFRSALKDSVSRDDEWPTYRHDGARSGYTPTGVSAELTPWWAADVGDKSTAPVVAEGKVFVAVPETHTLKAFNAETGAPVWEFVAGGRIDSPPTIARGRTMFGCADGHVYSLRTEDGQLAWRFQAAPEERRIIARGQLESVWPIPGSVLVSKDGVYCVAGRSSYLDGGLHLYRLDLATGRVLAEQTIYSRDRETAQQPDESDTFDMPGAQPDILSTDGDLIYMRKLAFDPQTLEPRPTRPHLYSPAGFLNDDWWHRTYWIYGTHFYSGYIGWFFAGREVPAGRLLSLDATSVYGYSYKPEFYRGATEQKYHLFGAVRAEQASQPPPDYARASREYRRLDSSTFRVKYRWTADVPLLGRAMIVAGDTLFVAGPPERGLRSRSVFEGSQGALLRVLSAKDGTTLGEYELEALPTYDGMAAAYGRLYLTTEEGRLLCMGYQDASASPAIAEAPFIRKAAAAPQKTSGEGIEPGLLGYWKLDDEKEDIAVDSSGLKNDAEFYGHWAKGSFGTCLLADGTVGALTLPDGPYLHFGTGEFSLSFWIKPDRYDLRVMGKERFPQTWWVINLLADGRLELVLGETQAEGKMVRPATRAPLPTDRWTHVACVVDRQNRQAKWYLNGTLDSTTEIPATLDGSLSVEGADLLIPSAYKTFVGLFDELRIYQKALSEAEIKAAYEAEQPTRTSVEYEATW